MPIRINLLAEAHAAEELRRKDPVKRGIYAAVFIVGCVLVWALTLQLKIVAAKHELSTLESQWKKIYKDYQVAVDKRRRSLEVEQKLAAAEGALVELRATGRGQDGVRFGSKLVQKFGYLANGLQSNDFKPTNQQVAVQKDLQDRLKASQGPLGEVMSRDLGAFNDMLRRANLSTIAMPAARRSSSQ